MIMAPIIKMSFIKQALPSTSFTKIVRPISPKIAKFGSAKFGQAKFGNLDGSTKQAKGESSFTKVALP